MKARRERILIVAHDETLRANIRDIFAHGGEYTLAQATSFEEALSEVLLTEFDLIITQAHLPDLSGLDLLTAVNGLRPQTRVIIVDEMLSAKGALAVFRLGGADYLYQPLQMSFLLMQAERQLEIKRNLHKKPTPVPNSPPVGATLTRRQLNKISLELSQLQQQTRASFTCLLDNGGNMLGFAGTLDETALGALTQALESDYATLPTLAHPSDKFHSVHYEGQSLHVYMVRVGNPYKVLLATVTQPKAQSEFVWLHSKRAIDNIYNLLEGIPQVRG